MVINSAAPVSRKNQSTWLLFKREIRNSGESDVSDVTLFWSIICLLNQLSIHPNFCVILSYLLRLRGEPACMRLAKLF